MKCKTCNDTKAVFKEGSAFKEQCSDCKTPENLNKENLFNELFSAFPATALKFHAWIDDYKEEVKWDSLFNSHLVKRGFNDSGSPYRVQAPKFHELPFDMQKGILLRFLCEVYPKSSQQYINRNKMAEILTRSFNVIELTLTDYNN